MIGLERLIFRITKKARPTEFCRTCLFKPLFHQQNVSFSVAADVLGDRTD